MMLKTFPLLLILLTACGGRRPTPVIEDLARQDDLSLFKLGSLRGTRDGDRLDAQAVLTDSSSILTIEMRFEIGAPSKLTSGTWRWSRNNHPSSGQITARSVTFLGGQDGPPSIGGTFDLVDSGAARYRVTIPVSELKTRLPGQPDWLRPPLAPDSHASQPR